MANCTLDMVRNGGAASQAHPCARHIADVGHSQCWQLFQRDVEKGHKGVFVGSKYAKDFKRSLEMFDLPWRSLLTGFPKEARPTIETAIACLLQSVPQDGERRVPTRAVDLLIMVAEPNFRLREIHPRDYPLACLAHQLTTHLPGKEWNFPILQAVTGAMQWPQTDVELVALRPEFPGDPNQDYDAQYNAANFRDYSGGHFRRISMKVKKQTFAEFIRERPPGVHHTFLALDCTYYLRKEVEELHKQDRERSGRGEEPRMSPSDSFIYASAVFPSLPGEYKLPWSSGTLVVENTRGSNPVPVSGWRPGPTAFLAALPLALSLAPLFPESDWAYRTPFLGIVGSILEVCRQIPIWNRLLPVMFHTIPQCWGLIHSEVMTRLQYVHGEPRKVPAKIVGCLLLVILTCWQHLSPTVTMLFAIYLMRV